MSSEITLWQGRPSQWLNLGPFLIAITIAIGLCVMGMIFPIFLPFGLALMVLPVLYLIWRWLKVRSQKFELTSERLRVTEGIFNQKIDEIELYRVKDIAMERPLWMRMTGLASVLLDTSDRSMPKLTLPAISNGVELREQLRKQVEEIRDKKRVREVDMEEPHDHDSMGGQDSHS
ncbi:MAG: hypothetical protein CFE26_10995, partial [Verrucomicrobiales bacterium VVV1]